MKYLILSLFILVVSCTLPDRFGAGLHGSQYDYLGAGTTDWPLTDKTGNDLGASLWVEWDLGPPKTTIIQMPRPEWIGELSRGAAPSTTVVTTGSDKEKPASSLINDTVQLGEAAKDWPVVLQLGVFVVIVLMAIAALFYIKKKSS